MLGFFLELKANFFLGIRASCFRDTSDSSCETCCGGKGGGVAMARGGVHQVYLLRVAEVIGGKKE